MAKDEIMISAKQPNLWKRNLSFGLIVLSGIGVCGFLRGVWPEIVDGHNSQSLLLAVLIAAVWIAAALLHLAKKYALSIFALLCLTGLYALSWAVISAL